MSGTFHQTTVHSTNDPSSPASRLGMIPQLLKWLEQSARCNKMHLDGVRRLQVSLQEVRRLAEGRQGSTVPGMGAHHGALP